MQRECTQWCKSRRFVAKRMFVNHLNHLKKQKRISWRKMSKPLIIIHVVVMCLLHKDFWFEPRSMMLISNLPKLDDTRKSFAHFAVWSVQYASPGVDACCLTTVPNASVAVTLRRGIPHSKLPWPSKKKKNLAAFAYKPNATTLAPKAAPWETTSLLAARSTL